MHAYLVNLDRSPDRLEYVSKQLEKANISYSRVPAVEGAKLNLPHPQFNERAYQLKHGKKVNPSEIGCYLSHLKALQSFLDSPHEHALICEDDIDIPSHASDILCKVIAQKAHWDIVKISKIHSSLPIKVIDINSEYHLSVNIGRHTGAGAYLVNRKAATLFLEHISVMDLPYDHAFDKEWKIGLRAFSLQPELISQETSKFTTTITSPRSFKRPAWLRYWTVFPYRLFTETQRIICRSFQTLKFLAS